MLRVILFDALLFGACGYAMLRGGPDGRLIGIICIVANFASAALKSPVPVSYSSVEPGVVAVDLLTFVAFTFVALRSNRFWPLWVSGLQLTTGLSHVLKAIQPDLMPLAYAAALRLWSYPILIILAVGTWRSHHRGVRDAAEPA